MISTLYWIHLPTHTDIETQGYLGVTTQKLRERWSNHKSAFKTSGTRGCNKLKSAYTKYGKDLIVTPLVYGTVEYTYSLENRLRSTPEIGWNICIGGDVNPRIGRKLSPEQCRRMRRVISDSQKATVRLARTKFTIITPKGSFPVMEAAELFGISKHTVYQRCKADTFPDWRRETIDN